MKSHTDFHSRAQRKANSDKQDLPGADSSLREQSENAAAASPPESPLAENHGRKSALTDVVRHADLWALLQKQLEGRLSYYQRQYDGELHPARRTEYKNEIAKTRWVLRWRRMNPGKLRPSKPERVNTVNPIQPRQTGGAVQGSTATPTKAALNRGADAWLQEAAQKIKGKVHEDVE